MRDCRWLLHEYRLGKIHLPRNRLHLPRRQTVPVGDYGEGIARQWLIGKDIEMVKMEPHLFNMPAPGR